MPKLKKTEAQRQLERERGLAVMLRSACILEHGNLETAAEQMAMSRATLYRNLEQPGSITIAQLSDMCRALPKEMKDTIRQLLL